MMSFCNLFRVKFIKRLFNGLIDIHLIIPPNYVFESGPVDRLRVLPDDVIMHCFHVKFIKKLSNGLIDTYLFVPPDFF
jgi:hypothetical protein